MALVIRDTSSVPGEGWIYPHVAAGKFVRVPSYGLLYPEVVKVYTANGVPPPSEDEVIAWLCANVHVPCYEQETKTPLVNKFSQSLPLPPTSCCGSAKK